MAKSKRISKGVKKQQSTSKVEKKIGDHKMKYVNMVKTEIAQFSTVFVLNINNIRTVIIKRIRDDFKESKIIFGKRRLIAAALDKNKLTDIIKGGEALLLTNKSYEEVREELKKYTSLEYSRTGAMCEQSVKIIAQPLKAFNSDLTPTLRDLGMPIDLKDGVIMLMKDYQICKKGHVLTNSMTRLLKFFNVQIAMFSVDVTAMWKDDVLTQFEGESRDDENLLEASVEIRCEQLDDGKFYFVPYPNAEPEATMECE